MAKAVKKTIKRRRERKNIEKGAAHIRSSFNNTMLSFQCDLLGLLRWPGLPRKQKVHPVRGTDVC